MKWIGQHIWDFISRFRSDVYLEDLADPGSDTDKFLVVDTNNKVGYRTGAEVLSDIGASSESTDLEFNGNTADGVLTYGGAAQIDVESTLMYSTPSVVQVELPANSFTAYAQTLTPTSAWATNSKNGVAFHTSFINSRNTASGQTNTHVAHKINVTDTATHVGTIDYTGVDISIDFANTDGTQKVKGIKNVLTDSDTADLYGIYQQVEDGGKDLYFLSSDDTTVDYFSLAVGASGATTMTTVDGGGAAADLTFNVDGSTIFAGPEVVVENAVTGMLTVQNTAANATGGTLNLKNTHGGSDGQDSDSCGYIKFWAQDDGTPSLTQYGNITTQASDVSSTDEAGTMRLQVLNNTGTGALLDGIAIHGNTDVDGRVDVTIGAGAASVTTIAGDLDIDGDNMTTAGAMTLTTGGTYEIATGGSGDITLDSAGNIYLETAGTNLLCDAAALSFDSSTANAPSFRITNNADDATGPEIVFKNNRDGNGLEDSDVLGTIRFNGEDASGNLEGYGSITSTVVESGDGDEAGQIAITVANDGTERNGITITADKGTAQEVDVAIANGTASTTTIAGDLTVTSKAIIQTRKFSKTSSTDHDYNGDVVYFGTAGSTYAQGDICYLHTDGSWVSAIADADNAGTGKLLAVALGSDPEDDGMLLRGMITLDHNTGNSNDGEPVYLSIATAGQGQTVPPSSSNNIVRIIGYKMGDDDEIWFNPDTTWIEIA